MNLCRSCGEDFETLRGFDEHRTGVHDYTLSEGLAKVPPVEDGRRCFDVDELVDFGWSKNEQGQWRYPHDWTLLAGKWEHAVPEADAVAVAGGVAGTA